MYNDDELDVSTQQVCTTEGLLCVRFDTGETGEGASSVEVWETACVCCLSNRRNPTEMLHHREKMSYDISCAIY